MQALQEGKPLPLTELRVGMEVRMTIREEGTGPLRMYRLILVCAPAGQYSQNHDCAACIIESQECPPSADP